jgi:hypothetical protein
VFDPSDYLLCTNLSNYISEEFDTGSPDPIQTDGGQTHVPGGGGKLAGCPCTTGQTSQNEMRINTPPTQQKPNHREQMRKRRWLPF